MKLSERFFQIKRTNKKSVTFLVSLCLTLLLPCMGIANGIDKPTVPQASAPAATSTSQATSAATTTSTPAATSTTTPAVKAASTPTVNSQAKPKPVAKTTSTVATNKDNGLRSITYKTLSPKQTEVVLTFSKSGVNMKKFDTKSPPRIILDFYNTTDSLHYDQKDVGQGVVHDVTTMETQDRTRVVLNLSGDASYTTQVVGNTVCVIITERVKSAYVKKPTYVFKQGSEWAGGQHCINDIDFHRTDVGGGEIILSLSDASMGINVKEEYGNVIVDFLNTCAKQKVLRRLDVTDFGTPVQFVQVMPRGQDTRMVITAKGDYEHLAYQVNNKFVVDINPSKVGEAGPGGEVQPQYTGERLSLNFQDIQVRAVLQILADFTGINIVASDSVTGNMTLRLNNIPWDEALDIILRTQGLDKRKVGSVIMIAPAQELVAREKADLEAQNQVQSLEPLQTTFISLNYAKGSEVAGILRSKENSLLSKRGSVTVDARTNSLLIQDTPAVIANVRDLVKKLDIPVRQVLIEARIVNVKSEFERSFGIRWGITKPDHLSGTLEGASHMQQNIIAGNPALQDVTFPERLNVNLPAANSPTGAPPGSVGIALANLGNGFLLDLELQAIETEGGGELISTPRLVTADQQEAYIEQGQEIPYQEAAASGATAVSFVNAVLKLKVTPQITPDDNIIMTLAVNQDSRAPAVDDVLGTPAIDTRSIETKVLVKNGDTIVLGGIYEEDNEKTVNRIPFLGSLPVVGFLFRNSVVSNDKKELLIFITPKIIEQNTLT